MKRLIVLFAISIGVTVLAILAWCANRTLTFQICPERYGVFFISGSGIDSVEKLEREIRKRRSEDVHIEMKADFASSVGDIGRALTFLSMQGCHQRVDLKLCGLSISLYNGHCHDNMRYFKEEDALQRYIMTKEKFFPAQDRDFNFANHIGAPVRHYLEDPDARDCDDVVQRARSLKAGHDNLGRRVVVEVYCGESLDPCRLSALVSVLLENGCNDLCLICF